MTDQNEEPKSITELRRFWQWAIDEEVGACKLLATLEQNGQRRALDRLGWAAIAQGANILAAWGKAPGDEFDAGAFAVLRDLSVAILTAYERTFPENCLHCGGWGYISQRPVPLESEKCPECHYPTRGLTATPLRTDGGLT